MGFDLVHVMAENKDHLIFIARLYAVFFVLWLVMRNREMAKEIKYLGEELNERRNKETTTRAKHL